VFRLKTVLVLAVAAVAVAGTAAIQSDQEGAPAAPADLLAGPYLQRPGQTEMTVMWIRSLSGVCTVRYGIGNLDSQVQTDYSQTGTGPDGTEYVYEARLTGLTPGQTYSYEVVTAGATGAGNFKTFAADPGRVSFIAYGDTKDGPATHAALAARFLAHDPAFILHAGDMTQADAFNTIRAQFHNPLAGVIGGVPILAARGNHEDQEGLTFRRIFALPNNERWYSFDYGNCHFTVLESTLYRHAAEVSMMDEMLAWVDADLAASTAEWKIVMYHEPSYDAGSRREEWGWYDEDYFPWDFLSVFRTRGVDLVINGHAHGYQRFYPMAKKGVNEDHPITHVITAGGGSSLSATPEALPHLAVHAEVYNYTAFAVEGGRLEAKAYKTDGTVIDSFVIEKRGGVFTGDYLAQRMWEDDFYEGLRVLYVDRDATGLNDGSSWANAFTDLQSALAAPAAADKVTEIWVAEGTYRPTAGVDRAATFTLRADVPVYGGFVGTETHREQRAPTAHLTVLSGDIGAAGDDSDNSYHVVTGADGGCLDGVTVTKGRADTNGGGMYNSHVRVTVVNCVFSDNSATANGGAIYQTGGQLDMCGSTLSGNSAADGGGLYFYDKNAEGSSTVSGCTFAGNTADGGGGGIASLHSTLSVDHCVFRGNSAAAGGGIGGKTGTMPVSHCTFSGNTATVRGAAACAGALRNCILWDNGDNGLDVGMTVDYSCVQGGYDGTGNIDADPLFVDAAGDDFHLKSEGGHWTAGGWVTDAVTSPCVDAGDPADAYSTEPLPNGGRVNMGAYGNTSQASKFGGNTSPVISDIPAQTCAEDASAGPVAFTVSDAETAAGSLLLSGASSNTALVPNANIAFGGSGASRTVTVTPAPGLSGTATITVTVTDAGGRTASDTFVLTVSAVNDPPSISSFSPADPVTVAAGATQSFSVEAWDPDGDALAYAWTIDGGAVPVTADAMNYSPLAADAGARTIAVTVSDGHGGSVVQSWAVTVTTVNHAPVITEGASVGVTMSEDGVPTPFSRTLNATDADGDTLTWSISTPAAHGTASAEGTGTGKAIGYTPAADYSGPDSFVVQVSDGSLSDTITVNVTVTAVNDAPVIAEGASVGVTMSEDGAPTAFSLTLHATDAEGAALTWSISSAAGHGTASASGTGASKAIGYTPAANYSGADSFVVRVSDGTLTDTIVVNVTVTAVNDAPVITEGTSVSVTMSEDGAPTPFSRTLNASDVDGDTLAWSISMPAAHGTASASGTGASKAIGYAPNANYSGTDSFVVRVSDGALADTITVNVTVTAVNDAPTANAQVVTTAEDTAKAVTLTGSDVEGGALTFAVVTGPAHGTLSGNGVSLTYTPAADYNGPDSFTFKVNDGALDSPAATVSITVTAANDAPVANGQSLETAVNTSKAITLTAADVDGGALSYVIVSGPSHGALSGSGAGRTYTPAGGYSGLDSFTFKANDGLADSNVATVSILVGGVSGSVRVWGYNNSGQLGLGTTTTVKSPAAVPGLSGVAALAVGEFHTLAVMADGTVMAWGSNKYGQVGDGTLTSRKTPVAIAMPGGAKAVAAAAGQYHSVALLDSGTIAVWGYNVHGELGLGTTTTVKVPTVNAHAGLAAGVTAVAAGRNHTLALLNGGGVVAWGYNNRGQLGNNSTTASKVPVAVKDGTGLANLSGVTAIAAGGYHSMALVAGGEVRAWGYNATGQLGDGTLTSRKLPVAVSGLSGVSAVSCGLSHTLALLADGTVRTWGANKYGQLGNNSTVTGKVPAAVPGLAGVSRIASGLNHNLVLLTDGTVKVWGYNIYGQLGLGTTTLSKVPVTVSGLSGGAVPAAGGSQSMVITMP